MIQEKPLTLKKTHILDTIREKPPVSGTRIDISSDLNGITPQSRSTSLRPRASFPLRVAAAADGGICRGYAVWLGRRLPRRIPGPLLLAVSVRAQVTPPIHRLGYIRCWENACPLRLQRNSLVV
jgi:hypothetical protein